MGLFKAPKYQCYLLYFAILTFITILMILEMGLSYVSSTGCYRVYANSSGNMITVYKSFYDNLQSQCQSLS